MPSSLPLLVVVFVAAAAGVWVAGIWLSRTTDVLSHRLHLGEALAGSILLAFTTNLPEVAITASAALAHHLGIAIGNILGGIAIQTVVLAVLDVWGLGRADPLTYMAASLQLVLEGALVIAVLVVAVMGTQLSSHLYFDRLEPAAVLIVVLWAVGLWLIGRASRGLPWQEQGDAPGGQDVPRGTRVKMTNKVADERGISTIRAALFFGATVLAAATSLPELSTGLASIRMRDYQLAVSDIFGGNAFLPVLFFVAALLSGSAVLPAAHRTDIYLTALGALLTVVYIFGLIFRPRRQILALGIDSAIVVALYALGVVGLIYVNR